MNMPRQMPYSPKYITLHPTLRPARIPVCSTVLWQKVLGKKMQVTFIHLLESLPAQLHGGRRLPPYKHIIGLPTGLAADTGGRARHVARTWP